MIDALVKSPDTALSRHGGIIAAYENYACSGISERTGAVKRVLTCRVHERFVIRMSCRRNVREVQGKG
jgi:hypothetical protein